MFVEPEGSGGPMARDRRSPGILIVAVLLVVALTAALAWHFRAPLQQRAFHNLSESLLGTVGPTGFDVTVEENRLGRSERIRVSVPPGAAPEGTEVAVQVVHDRTRLGMPELDGLLAGIGLSVDITLDGGTVQPEKPVIVEITTPAAELGHDPVVASTLENGTLTPLRTTSRPDGDLVIHTAEMDHLSLASFFRVDLSGVVDSVRSTWDSMMGRSDQPDCVGESVTVGGRTYSAGTARTVEGRTITSDSSDAVWPCLEAGPEDTMIVTLQNNYPVGWAVRAEPRPVNARAHGTAIDDLVSGILAHSLSDLTRTEGYVLPNMTTHLVYEQPARYIGLEQDPLPGLLMSLAFGIDQALTVFRGAPTNAGKVPPDPGVRAQLRGMMDRGASNDELAAVMANRDIADCFLALLDHAGQTDDMASFVNGVVTCFQSTLGDRMVDKLVGVALGTLTGGLQLVAGQLLGAWNRANGDFRVGIVITGDEPTDSPEVATEGPGNDTPMDEGMQILIPTWQRHGASLTLVPDWTGRLRMNSGAVTGGEWAVRWERESATEVTVIVGEQLSAYPESLGSSGPVPGATYSARMSSDGTRLSLTRSSGDGFDSVELCSSEAMGPDCGA